MNGLKELLNQRFIIKDKDKEKFYRVKDDLSQYKKFIQDKLGYRLIVKPNLIKLEKLPGQPESFMGITEFSSTKEYCFLCLVLMFLEDKSPEEQFILSQLTEHISLNYPGGGIDWTVYSTRKSFIRVMKFCAGNEFFKTTDGDDDEFIRSEQAEALYENTGISRYFARNFTMDIMGYDKPEDFEKSEWLDMDTDRGIIRRHRVYRRLLLSPSVSRSGEEDEDFLYIRNIRNTIEKDMEEMLDCDLQIHRGAAFLLASDEGGFGRCFPENNNMSDIVLLLFKELRREYKSFNLLSDESIIISHDELSTAFALCRKKYENSWGKTYREKGEKELLEEAIRYMENLGFIEKEQDNHIRITPVAGKIVARFTGEEEANGKHSV